MLGLTKEQLKAIIVKGNFHKKIDPEELCIILAQIIEFSNFLKDKLPVEKPAADPVKIRVFIQKTLTEDQFKDFVISQKRIFVDFKDQQSAADITNKLIGNTPGLIANLTIFTYPDLPADRQ